MNFNRTMYILGIVLLVTYVYNANSIVNHILPFADKTYTINLDEPIDTMSNDVYCAIERVDSLGTSLEKIRIYGWAYKEQEALSSDERFVHPILINTKNTYFAQSTIALRPDIYEKESAKNRKLPSISLGFEARFSSINIKDGIYQLWLKVTEAKGEYGYINTGVQIYKKGSMVCDLSDVPIKPISETVAGNMRVEFDQFELLKNREIALNGWYILNNIQYGKTETFLEISDRTGRIITHKFGPLKTRTRNDIANAFKNQDYLYSGFVNTIKLPENFDETELDISVIMKNDDIYYRSSTLHYVLHSDGQKRAYKKADEDIEAPSKNKNSDINAASLEKSQNIRMALDDLSIQGSMVQAIGWCVNIIPQQEAMGEAYLQIKDSSDELRYYKLNLSHRQDITATFGEKHTVNGFNIQIPKDDFTGDRIEVRVIYLIDENHGVVSDKVAFLPLE